MKNYVPSYNEFLSINESNKVDVAIDLLKKFDYYSDYIDNGRQFDTVQRKNDEIKKDFNKFDKSTKDTAIKIFKKDADKDLLKRFSIEFIK